RFSGSNVSFNLFATMATVNSPTKPKKKKMLCQLADSKDKIKPPTNGATIGATALITSNKQTNFVNSRTINRTHITPLDITTTTKEKNFVSSRPLNTSRTTARDRTTPAEAVNPCKNRATIKITIFGANAHKMEAKANKDVAISNGFLLPWASLIGPTNS